METLGRMIRARRLQLGLTLQQVADGVGCAKSYLSEIENERRDGPPSEAILGKLERALRLDHGALLLVGKWEATPAEIRREVIDIEQGRRLGEKLARLIRAQGLDGAHRSGELARLVEQLAPGGEGEGNGAASSPRVAAGNVRLARLPVQVPVINRVAAGYPTEFTDLGYPARVADEYVAAPDVTDPEAFAARVVGDSMAPLYREGDIVVFSPERDTPAGSDCFVRLERDDETTFKRVYFEEDAQGRELIRLQPLNSVYPARVLPREDVAGMYAAVYVVRPVGPEA